MIPSHIHTHSHTQMAALVIRFGAAHFDDGWDFGIDVVVAKMQTCSEGTFVQQRVLVKLNLATCVPLVQAHSAVGKVDHFP